jgi:hypothetical protein
LSFRENYLRKTALPDNDHLPIDGDKLMWEIANDFSRVSNMAAKKLFTEAVQSYVSFCFDALPVHFDSGCCSGGCGG